MRRIVVIGAIGMLAMVLASGCAMLQRLGITEDIAAAGVRAVLIKEGLSESVTDAQIKEVIAIVRADQRLNEIGNEIAAQQAMSNRIEEIVAKYVVDGKVAIDPPVTDTPSTNMWDRIKWTSGNYASATVEDFVLTAQCGSGKVSFSYPKHEWPSSEGVEAIGCFFVWNGATWEGGKFDWIRTGGQTSKGYENIEGGYQGLRAPPSGTKVAWAWVALDKKHRTSLAESVWK